VGFDGAPHVLGIDAQGREVLAYVPGNVPRDASSPEIATDRALSELSRVLRRLHEAVSGFSLPLSVEWYGRADPGPGSVVCHNDLTPRNTVFREGSPVAFVDFDLAWLACRPGTSRTLRGSSCHSSTMRAACAKTDTRRWSEAA
jgi:Ser/Thr protein kinase RdoA (MazF antagonist)